MKFALQSIRSARYKALAGSSRRSTERASNSGRVKKNASRNLKTVVGWIEGDNNRRRRGRPGVTRSSVAQRAPGSLARQNRDVNRVNRAGPHVPGQPNGG